MTRSLKTIFRYMDWPLSVAVLVLLALGLAVLFALGKNSDEGITNFIKQGAFAGVGMLLAFICMKIDVRTLRPYIYILFGISAFLLVLVLIFGVKINNTTGWFSFGFVNLQPIEFVKILWILAFAGYCASKGFKLKQWRELIIPGFMFVALFGLVLLQPDLGSGLVLAAITLGMIIIAPVRTTQIALILFLCAAIIVVSWFAVLRDYQKERIRILFAPDRAPLKEGYHVTQSIIAVGSGGWFGKGLGFGSQSQLKFLPEQQTDFIFAVIAEDLGFVGAGLVILVFIFIIARGFRIAWKSKDGFATLVSYGIIVMLFTHIFINIGMNVGLFPVAGIPLPFVSYGGSSLLAMFTALGLLQGIHISNRLGVSPA